jgi:cysteine sulfinate desulfinase/cysteine desulfurase-like protein
MKRHFCDWNSGNPVDPRVKAAMQPFFDAEFGNPSSPHAEGRAARRAVEQARAYVASLAGVESRDVVFTSGATESNHLAVTTFGAGRVLFSAVEHPCMVAACEVRGAAVRIPVTATGDVDLSAFDALTRSKREFGCRSARWGDAVRSQGSRCMWTRLRFRGEFRSNGRKGPPRRRCPPIRWPGRRGSAR